MLKRTLIILFAGLHCLPLFIGCHDEIPETIRLAYEKTPGEIDFNFHVKPILSDKCFPCHGPDKANRKADLRLDSPQDVFSPRGENRAQFAIFPGKLSKSDVFRRIISEDDKVKMPLPESNLSLTREEIAIIAKWIEQGAEYKTHWSLIKPELPRLPKVKNSGWPANPIDYFILSQLESQGLRPSEQVMRETLIRRLSFDLTGLPPTFAEVDAFKSDDSPDAYERLVDRLLASKAYGERMAMDWLDVARYADSDGYLDDKHRDFTPWRDWVIDAFNRNMSYDRFVTWQLAGDLIPNPTRESILATAFNRLHRRNSEAGIVFEEFRTEYVADRTSTVGKAFLGLSLECARCHDHKYDPVSQEDFYKIFAFFNSTNELGTAVYGLDITPGPALLLTTDQDERIIDSLQKSIEALESRLLKTRQSPDRGFEQWVKDSKAVGRSLERSPRKRLIAYHSFDRLEEESAEKAFAANLADSDKPAVLKEAEVRSGAKGNAVFISDFTRVSLGEKIGWFERTSPFSISLYVYPDTLYEEAGIFFHCENLRVGFKGYSLHLENNRLKFIIAHAWPQNAIQVVTEPAIPVKEWTGVTITYDGSSKAEGVRIFLNGQTVPLQVDWDNLYKGILYEENIHTYGFSGFTMGYRDKSKTFKKGGIDELKIYGRQLTALEVLHGFDSNQSLTVIEGGNDPGRDELLREHYFANHHRPFAAIRDSLLWANREDLNRRLNRFGEIMVMGDLPEPRPTFVLERGFYNAHRQEVSPGVPESILPYDARLPSNRLGLTRWLFDPDHPLTARVFVNRIWQMHFGQGIVRTSDDFGNQGELPSHPELLDWLAVTFTESGWDIKQLHKAIVMSATYRQTSRITPDLLQIDPDNVLMSRGPRFRLSAEMVRDNALAISGLLVTEIGGSSVYPYQPDGLWDEITNKKWRYKYLQEPGEGLYRRSIYTIWKRTAPPPSMLIFDAPDRGTCVVKRRNTSTPLQALVLLNDPQYLEAARVMAEDIIREHPLPSDQLRKAFRLATGRLPTDNELVTLMSFYDDELTRFAAKKPDAIAYLSIGEKAKDESLDPVKTAALATVISGVMNTTESFTRI